MGPGGMGMGMGMRPELSQKQQLQLSPRMMQAMKILQMPIMALQEKIATELLENPVLDSLDPQPDDADSTDDDARNGFETEKEKDPTDPRSELVINEDGSNEADFGRLDDWGADWGADWPDDYGEESRPSANRIAELSDQKHLAEANMVCRPQNLLDHLNDQLTYLDLPEDKLRLVRHVLSFIQKSGYLHRVEVIYHDEDGEKIKEEIVHHPISLEEIAELFDEPVTIAAVEEALHLIQELEPAGVGARDLRECLLLQITVDMPLAKVMRSIIQNHLEDIQHNRLPNIQKKTGFDFATIQEAIDELKHLDPKPGARFESTERQFVTPDIAVEKNEDGDYEVRLLDDWTPRIYVKRRYLKIAHDKQADPKEREYIRQRIQSARWLIDAIEQRRGTLLRVTRAIIDHQRGFLDAGLDHIEPLKMQQIADLVDVHVTTVSRAVDDKWVQTPRGVFPLKRFFGGGKTNTVTGEEVAYEAIVQKLLELIEHENKADPLSDEEIVNQLNDAGYPVARRTVTKYRQKHKIPSSRQRKVWSS